MSILLIHQACGSLWAHPCHRRSHACPPYGRADQSYYIYYLRLKGSAAGATAGPAGFAAASGAAVGMLPTGTMSQVTLK